MLYILFLFSIYMSISILSKMESCEPKFIFSIQYLLPVFRACDFVCEFSDGITELEGHFFNCFR